MNDYQAVRAGNTMEGGEGDFTSQWGLPAAAAAMDTAATLAHIDSALTALNALRATARQMPTTYMNPFGSINQMTIVIQNLDCARTDIAKDITRDHMGYVVPAAEVVAFDDLEGIIDN